MNIKTIIERNTTLSILSILLTGFLFGISVYRFVLETANLDTVQKGGYLLKEDLEKKYILIEKYEEQTLNSKSMEVPLKNDKNEATSNENTRYKEVSLSNSDSIYNIIKEIIETGNIIEYDERTMDWYNLTLIQGPNKNLLYYIKQDNKAIFNINGINFRPQNNIQSNILENMVRNKNDEFVYQYTSLLKIIIKNNQCEIIKSMEKFYHVIDFEYEFDVSTKDSILLNIFRVTKNGKSFLSFSGLSKDMDEKLDFGHERTYDIYRIVDNAYKRRKGIIN